DNLVKLAHWAKFLVCAAPGGAGTRHLVNADVLTALGPKGYGHRGAGRCPGIEAHRGGGPGRARGRTRGAADTVGAPAVRERRGHAALRGTRTGGPHRGHGVDPGQPERAFHGEAAAVACVSGEDVASSRS